jgi:hypothetical protein
MVLRRLLPAVGFALAAAMASMAAAQPSPPHLAYVFPAGGQRGATFEVKVGGQFLTGAASAFISGNMVQVEMGEYVKPLTPQQATQLRNRATELRNQPTSPAVQKELLEIRQKLATFDRNMNPILAETVTLKITIASTAALGKRELRLATPQGLSNPLVFCVGNLPEYHETEPQLILPQVPAAQPQPSAPRQDMQISLPATVNGRIKPAPTPPMGGAQAFTPGDVDRYRFHATRGQQLVAVVSARELIPYLADAVPGWFQATLVLYDSAGKELAYNDDYRFNPDPVIHYEIPRDGDYVIEIKDALYRGREDFVYRLTLGELPFVTSIFPLGGHAGGRTTVAISGWTLRTQTLTMDNFLKPRGIYPLPLTAGESILSSLPFAIDTISEVAEKEPNDTRETAQEVQLPVIINGRIDRPGDWDVFSFAGRAGQRIVAEVTARRLGSPLDSVLRLTDASGKQLAFNDDFDDKAYGLETHHADSLLSATLPAAGTYYVHIGDIQHHGGPEYAYRLRISPPRPDFELRVVPSSVNLRGGANAPLTVYAIRRDGFAGEIDLTLKDAPPGFALSGGRIPANQDQVRCTLIATPGTRGEAISLHMDGQAQVQGLKVTRPAVPADDMMQAFAYRHLVPAQEMKVMVLQAGAIGLVRVLDPTPLLIPAGGTARMHIAAPSPAFATRFQLELNDSPEGITLQSVVWTQQFAELVFIADKTKAKAGLAGNLIVNIVPKPPTTTAQVNRPRTPVGSLPAIPFRISAN